MGLRGSIFIDFQSVENRHPAEEKRPHDTICYVVDEQPAQATTMQFRRPTAAPPRRRSRATHPQLHLIDTNLASDFDVDFDVDFECELDALDAYFERTSVKFNQYCMHFWVT